MAGFDDPTIGFDDPLYSFGGAYLGTADTTAIECWVTTPGATYISHLDRSAASPFRAFAVSIELNKPGAGSLEYFETNATVDAYPGSAGGDAVFPLLASAPFAHPVTTATVDVTVSDLTGATDMRAEIQAQLTTSGRLYRFPASGIIRIDGRLTIYTKDDIEVDLRGCSIRHSANDAAARSATASVWDVYDSSYIWIHSSTLTGDLRGANADPGSLGTGGDDGFQENDFGHMVNVNDCQYVEVGPGISSQDAWGDFIQVADDLDGARLRTHDVWCHGNAVANVGRSFISVTNGYRIWVESNDLGQAGLQVWNLEPYQSDANIHHFYYMDNTGAQDYAHVVSGSNFGLWGNLNGAGPGAITDVYCLRNAITGPKGMQVVSNVTSPRRARITVALNTATATVAPLYGYPGVITIQHADDVTEYANVQPLSSGVLLDTTDSTILAVGVTAATPALFDFGNLVWMKYRDRRLVWIIEQRTTKFDENEAASGWYQVAGRGVLQLLGDRIVWPTGFDGTNQPKDWTLPVSAGSYSAQVLGLLSELGFGAYWCLADTSGVMVDFSGFGHDGTVAGSLLRGVTGLLEGVVNGAAFFDGSSYVDAGDIFDFSGTGSMSSWYQFAVECWVRPTSSPTTAQGERAIISKSSTPTNGWELSHSRSAVTFRRGADVVTGPALPMGKVTHLLVTYDGLDLVMYRNSVAQEPVRSDVTLGGTAQPLRIGMRSNETTLGFVGTIDEVAIYDIAVASNRILTADDAIYHYATGRNKALRSQFRTFVQEPAGTMLQALIEESNGRFPVAIAIGTIEVDVARNDLWNQSFRFDDLLDIVDLASDFGDVWMDGLTFNFSQPLGTDLSATVIFEEGGDILRVEDDRNDRESLSWVVAEGAGEGAAAKVRMWPDSVPAGRRREAYVDAKDVRTGKQLLRTAKRAIDLQGLQHSIGLDLSDTRYRALIDYAVGDTVGVIVPSRDLDESLRIVAMYLAEDGERIRVAIDVNTQRTEHLLAMEARQRRTSRELEIRQRQPQGQSTFTAFAGSGVFDSSNTHDVAWTVPDRIRQVEECIVTVHFRQYTYAAAGGVTTETMPASHSVRTRLYQDAALVHAWTITDDDADLDLTDYVDGPGKYKLVLDSDAGQPQGGRLTADVHGYVLGTIGTD